MSNATTTTSTIGVWRNPDDLTLVRDMIAAAWVAETIATWASCKITPVLIGILWHYTLPVGVTAAVLQTGPTTATGLAGLDGDVYGVLRPPIIDSQGRVITANPVKVLSVDGRIVSAS